MNVRQIDISELSTLLIGICAYLRRIIVIIYLLLFLGGRHPAEGLFLSLRATICSTKVRSIPILLVTCILL